MVKNRIVSFLLIIAMVVSMDGLLCRSSKVAEAATAAVDSFTRQTINFNREWKFVRDDIEGAYSTDYDDSNWYNVGLPHDFSIPYWQDEKHYTGYGWYRKNFEVSDSWIGNDITLDFAGVFHTAEVYVNGELAGTHEGGYTGFEINISDYVHKGSNTVAVRVNNIWKATLAPRAGEHMFTGGIYRDVNLIVKSPVHVAWYGTFVQTPEVSESQANIRMLTEVANNSNQTQTVNVMNTVYDADKNVVTTINSQAVSIGAGKSHEFDDTSQYIKNPKLWSPEHPNLYSVHTEVMVNGKNVDQYDTTFGFRWYRFDKDEGFFLNGEHYWIDGINAHQDHAGWANAVTTDALYRDVAMIKEAGLNFIRGSHYPHSPAYGDACDKYGLLFWSEAAFWCTSAWGEGTQNQTSDDYKSDGYPTTGDPKTEEEFEQSCIDCLSEMIRINRNHPSIIVWSMGNEPFFGDNAEKKKALISRMAGVAKELDPTRTTAIGGTQRGSFDHLPNVDIAGYNGDGASMPEYQDPGVGNLVSEYSTRTANRPDKYEIFYGSVQTDDNGEPIRYPWRSGVALWCSFHHGSILSRSYGDMGIIDYYRLPLNIWYCYRENRTGVEPEFSQDGTPTKLKLTASSTTIKNDGTSDSHIIVTVTDDEGNWLNDEPEVTFEIVDGPGIFPTGKTITFKPGDSMRDGKAAIEFRSYYAGNTTIKAYSESDPDIEPATINIMTVGNGSADEPDIETMYGAFMSNGGYVPSSVAEPTAYRYHKFTGCPMNASSGQSTAPYTQDGDENTEWRADVPGSNQWMYMEIEHGGMKLYKARLSFKDKVYPFKIQCKRYNISDEEWITLKEFDKDAIKSMPAEIDLGGEYMRYIRFLFDDVPENEYASLAEMKLYGIRADATGYFTGMKDVDDITGTISDGKFEHTFDLEKDAPDTARFQTEISADSSETAVTYSVYADGELVYEKMMSDAKSPCKIDVSVNKVKQLKVIAAAEKNVTVKLSNTMLMGAYRDITISSLGKDKTLSGNESIITQVCAGINTLIPGKKSGLQARIANKSDKRVSLAYALLLYKADGTLIKTSVTSAVVPGKGKSVFNMNMDIPENIGKLDKLVLVGWNADTLVPVTDEMPIYEDGTISTVNSISYEKQKADMFAALRDAMQIITAGDAAKYTDESKAGFTEAIIYAGNLSDKSTPSDYENAAKSLKNAVSKLVLVSNGNAAAVDKPAGTQTTSGGSSVQPKAAVPAKKIIKKGKIYKSGKFRYKVLKVSKKKAEVSLVKPVPKKIKKAVILGTVKINGTKCKVTRVGEKAFANCKKLKKVVIGKNIKQIGKKAFYNTKSLSNVIIKSKSIKKVAKDSFKGTGKKVKYSFPKSKAKVYRKLISEK